jgi:phosphoribosylformimino-5-aminoimidazole carboxamide ribotide isomerase
LAIREPGSITQIQKKFGSDRIIVALDHKNGLVMINGWTSETTLSLRNALKKYSELGAKSFLLTSIARDGTLAGPDLETLRQARRWSSGEIIAAGGIGTLQDLVSLKRVGADAAIVGKALYEERFTLSEAIASMKEN